MQMESKMKIAISVVLLMGFVLNNSASALERAITLNYDSPLLAQRGEAKISQLDFDGRMQSIPEHDRAGFLSDPVRLEEVITQLLLVRSFADQAIADGLLEDPTMQAELHHLVTARLSERYREILVEEQQLDDYTNQAREIYLLDTDRFREEPEVSFSHILIGADKPDAETTAAAVLQRIQSGESMVELARQISDDPSVVQNNGQFDAIPIANLEEQFRQGISELEISEIGVIQSAFGWHVVDLQSSTEGRQLEFEEVADELREQARQRHHQQIIERALRQHYSQELVIADGAVADLLDRYLPQE